ncbi:MAG: hypothetical protein IJD23_01365 [Spirochaetaceae bacterium]|nr:hypothetical protein [Spirochaetaceae bacterium]
MKKIIFTLLILFFIVSCQSNKISNLNYKDKESYMYGMVYDFENQPVENADIIINDLLVAQTDVQGRFILTANNSSKELTITIKKETYETIISKIVYDPINVLYFRLNNTQQLLTQAENALQNNLYEESINFIQRALTLSPHRTDVKYLECIVLFKKEDYNESFEKIQELQILEPNNKFIEKLLKRIETQINLLD